MFEPDALEGADDLDAFNDDTFGVGAEEWHEDKHEELAQMTEEERRHREVGKRFWVEEGRRKWQVAMSRTEVVAQIF